MPLFSSKVGEARAFALAGAAAALIGASALSPARAGDDGYAPLWSGIGGMIGLAPSEEAPAINYQERGRLVLPPQMALPPPAAPAAQNAAAWPVDPDVEKARKKKQEKLNSERALSAAQLKNTNNLVPVDQLRADGSATGQTGADGRCADASPRYNCNRTPFSNVLEWVGLAKPDEVVAGQEPPRDWLTDPPKGYRMPTASTVATFDVKQKDDPKDPRSFLYQKPDDQ